MDCKTITAAIAILSTTPAFADNTQLALSTGVEPGALTTVELIQLRRDIEEDNSDGAALRVRRAMEKGNVEVTRSAE